MSRWAKFNPQSRLFKEKGKSVSKELSIATKQSCFENVLLNALQLEMHRFYAVKPRHTHIFLLAKTRTTKEMDI